MSWFSVGCHAEVRRPGFSACIWLTGTEEHNNPERTLAAQHAVKSQTFFGALCKGNSSKLSTQALPCVRRTPQFLSVFLFFFLWETLVLIPRRQCQATSCVCSCERGSVLRHCGHRLQNSLVTKDKHGRNCWRELLSARRVPLKEKLIGHSGGREAVQGLLFSLENVALDLHKAFSLKFMRAV